MGKPFLVFEDIDAVSRHELFRLLGTRWEATRFAWLSPVFWCALGLAVSLLVKPPAPVAQRVVSGIGYGLMLMAANALHSIGHIVAGRFVGEPMAVNLLTATRDVSVYARKGSDAPRRRRIQRSLGGPLANLAVGALALAVGSTSGTGWLRMFGLFNLLIGIWTLLPIPTLDGAVIWGSLRKRSRP